MRGRGFGYEKGTNNMYYIYIIIIYIYILFVTISGGRKRGERSDLNLYKHREIPNSPDGGCTPSP